MDILNQATYFLHQRSSSKIYRDTVKSDDSKWKEEGLNLYLDINGRWISVQN